MTSEWPGHSYSATRAGTRGVYQRWRQPRVEAHLRPPRPGTLLAGDVPASWPDLRDALAGCLREVGDKRDHGSDCALSNPTSSLRPWLPASTGCSQSSARESANQCPQPSGLPRLHSFSLPILKGQKSLQESERQDGSDPTVARPSFVDDACSAVLARPSAPRTCAPLCRTAAPGGRSQLLTGSPCRPSPPPEAQLTAQWPPPAPLPALLPPCTRASGERQAPRCCTAPKGWLIISSVLDQLQALPRLPRARHPASDVEATPPQLPGLGKSDSCPANLSSALSSSSTYRTHVHTHVCTHKTYMRTRVCVHAHTRSSFLCPGAAPARWPSQWERTQGTVGRLLSFPLCLSAGLQARPGFDSRGSQPCLGSQNWVSWVSDKKQELNTGRPLALASHVLSGPHGGRGVALVAGPSPDPGIKNRGPPSPSCA